MRIFAVQPDAPDDAAHGFQRALAADAVDDEHGGSLVFRAGRSIGHAEISRLK
jgi:hypothetical protein